MQVCSANRLSYTAIGNLLQLLILICPVANKLPTSFYKFRSFFQLQVVINGRRPILSTFQFRNFCTVCRVLAVTICFCFHVHCVIFSILKFSSADHWECLQRPADRVQEESIFGDVWDGSALRPLRAKGRFFST